MQTTPDAIPSAAPAADGRPEPAVPTTPADTVDTVDTDTILHTVNRALAHGSALPSHEELVELADLLRGHIRLLLPLARAHAATLPPATPRWLRYRARLTWICNQAGRGLGESLPSARQQVRSLAHDCRWLLKHTPARNGKATP